MRLGGKRHVLGGPCAEQSAAADALQASPGASLPLSGAAERQRYEIQFSVIFDQIAAYAAGNPINVVNPQVFDVLRGRRTS
jgi:hypothetical protein